MNTVTVKLSQVKVNGDNPQNGQSPYKLCEGALVPAGKDSNGNIIYKFNGARF